LNEQLYKHHLKCAATWHNPWLFIQNHVHGNLQLETEALYEILNRKIDNLINKQLRKTGSQQPIQHQRFYQRTINLTNIRFTKQEQTVLYYGLQYSLEKPLKTYWMNLIIETERPMKLLDNKSQNAFRIMASRKLKQIYNSKSNINAIQKHQLYIVNKLKRKLLTRNAMLTQADKGRTTVTYKEQYTNKIHNFITENNIQPLHKNPINKDHKHIQEILQQNNLIFNKNKSNPYFKRNPTPPTLNAQLKLHKPNIPIRPVVNNKNAPTYKTAKKN